MNSDFVFYFIYLFIFIVVRFSSIVVFQVTQIPFYGFSFS